MRFRIEQKFNANTADVLAALSDPSYLAMMAELPDLSAPVVEDQQRTTTTVSQRLRFQFAGKLPDVVTRVIDPSRLAWQEFTEIDLTHATATFRMVPVHYQKFFTCTGGWRLTSTNTTETVRVIDGNLKVNSPVPFVGGKVERAIVSGLEERLQVEPGVFDRWNMANRPGR
jgi:hypothetical protein